MIRSLVKFCLFMVTLEHFRRAELEMVPRCFLWIFDVFDQFSWVEIAESFWRSCCPPPSAAAAAGTGDTGGWSCRRCRLGLSFDHDDDLCVNKTPFLM